MAVLFDIENDIISQTFGNRDIDSICSFLYDTDDHLSSFLDWLGIELLSLNPNYQATIMTATISRFKTFIIRIRRDASDGSSMHHLRMIAFTC